LNEKVAEKEKWMAVMLYDRFKEIAKNVVI
jgi:hypothetical protein